MPPVMTREELDLIRCDEPSCDEINPGVVLFPRCHPDVLTIPLYIDGELRLECAECGTIYLSRPGRRLMPSRLCLEARCPNPATAKGRCDEHRKAHERGRSRARRDTSHKSFYDTQKWRMTARHEKHLNPICEHCDQALAQEVHHDPSLKVLLATGRDPYEPAVLVALCKPCHSDETLLEQRAG